MALVTLEDPTCYRCGRKDWGRGEYWAGVQRLDPDALYECAVCKALGDRALVPLLRTAKHGTKAERDEAFRAFYASPPGSVLFKAGLMRRGVPEYGHDFITFNRKEVT